ncbi:hypothetical protein GCM10023322_57660 [Rugosimonospora acidiphila]|uniref:Secreted protein n=1 Tax=Rugosimonospora acidiphila TaxID=556531 RepID=A0ABP9SCA1_9ACTN
MLSIIGAGGGLGAATAAALRWRKTKADTADVLTDTALTLIEPLRVRIQELDREMLRVRYEARETATELRRLRTAILNPSATLDSLRELVMNSGRDRSPS